MKNSKTKKIALMGIFCALAAAISYLESLIPSFIPGVKPGFSNIVTMFCVSSLGVSYGLAVVVFKAVFALLTRGATSFFMSLSGGLLSFLVMTLLFKFTKNTFGYIGIGVLSAVFHNIGQFAVACIISDKEILRLAPILLVSAVICGLLTGIIFKYLLPVLNKLSIRFSVKPKSA